MNLTKMQITKKYMIVTKREDINVSATDHFKDFTHIVSGK